MNENFNTVGKLRGAIFWTIFTAHAVAIVSLGLTVMAIGTREIPHDFLKLISFEAYRVFIAAELTLVAAWAAWSRQNFIWRLSITWLLTTVIYLAAVGAAVHWREVSSLRSIQDFLFAGYFLCLIFVGFIAAPLLALRATGYSWALKPGVRAAASDLPADQKPKVSDAYPVAATVAGLLLIYTLFPPTLSWHHLQSSLFLLFLMVVAGTINLLTTTLPGPFGLAVIVPATIWCFALMLLLAITATTGRPTGETVPASFALVASYVVSLAATIWTQRAIGFRMTFSTKEDK